MRKSYKLVFDFTYFVQCILNILTVLLANKTLNYEGLFLLDSVLNLFVQNGTSLYKKKKKKKNSKAFIMTCQGTKKFRSDSPGLVDFAVGLVEFILHLPDGQVKVSA